MSVVPAKRLTQHFGTVACPHCGHHHPSEESVRLCGKFKAGWKFVDADGYVCNGPYTRPDGDGLPRKPVKLVKKSCRTCGHAAVSVGGGLLCTRWGTMEDPQASVPILDALVHCTDARTHWSSRAPHPPIDLRQAVLFEEEPRPKKRRQCKHCPWKVTTNPRDIPNGYCERKHKALESTIANPDIPPVVGAVRVMACHETPVGRELACVGWLANQLGPGNNIALRMAVSDHMIDADFELDGEQHLSLAETLPSD